MSVRLTGESEQDYYSAQAPAAARISVQNSWSSSDTATAAAVGAVAGAAIGFGAAASGVDFGSIAGNAVEYGREVYEGMDFKQGFSSTFSNVPAEMSLLVAGSVITATAQKVYDKTGGCFTQ